ncbi:MAG: CHAD domain-containing protein [Phormidesmis sp. RL_2_1]|nr:CHAD domain-containing protein [Phormidesmis sp. RL_2_1]
MTSQQISQDETLLGGYAYQIIRQQSKRIFKLRSQVLADQDMEALHEMRIGTRRLRAALALFTDVVEIHSPASGATQTLIDQTLIDQTLIDQNLTKGVGKLTKALGKVRDTDVMQQWLKTVMQTSLTDKKEKKTVRSLLKKLKKRRQKAFSHMEKFLKGKTYKTLKKQIKQWVEQPTFSPTAQQPAAREAVTRIVEPINQLLQQPGWLIATRKQRHQTMPSNDITLAELNQLLAQEGAHLHSLRKQIKGIRYQMEFFRGLFDITYAAQVREFRTLQNLLGQLQDQLVIAQFFTDELGPEWPQQLPTIEAAFKTSRLALWQQWQPYQDKYLKLRHHLPLHLPEMTPAVTAT